VVQALELRMQKEELNKSFMEWKHKSINHYQSFIIERLFNEVNNVIRKHFTPRIADEINKQMCESVLYKCEKLDVNHAFEFENQSDSSEYDKVENIEDYYDLKQTCLKELLKSISKKLVKEVWRVVPYMALNS
ncbi:12078_t:CDS:2, partial [Dentiscutata erythropus]